MSACSELYLVHPHLLIKLSHGSYRLVLMANVVMSHWLSTAGYTAHEYQLEPPISNALAVGCVIDILILGYTGSKCMPCPDLVE
jgi:hypothetical protein